MDKFNENDLNMVAGGIDDKYANMSDEEKQKIYQERLSELQKRETGVHLQIMGRCPKCGKENRVDGDIVCFGCEQKQLREEIFGLLPENK